MILIKTYERQMDDCFDGKERFSYSILLSTKNFNVFFLILTFSSYYARVAINSINFT